MKYLKVKNWSEFQHYKDRNPPWIKLHRALLDQYEFCSLPDAQKAHLVMIWIHASQNDGLVPNDPKFLEQKLSVKGLKLDIFIERGFLIAEQDASSALADDKQTATKSVRLEEKRREEKKDTQPSVALPDWMPMASWLGYLEMRKKKRKEPTPRAIELLLGELSKLRAAGHDVAAVLDKSTVNGWTDVYPPKLGEAPSKVVDLRFKGAK